MHRVDFKKRKKFYFRILSYSLITVLTIITSAGLLYAALGYRIDNKGDVIRSGLLIVDSNPVSAEIFINGKNKNDPTASRFVLPAGHYNVQLQQSLYRTWSRDVILKASSVENLYYPLLLPTELKQSKQLSINSPDIISQSPGRNLVFVYSASQSNPRLIALNKNKSTVSTVSLPSSFTRSDGSLGKLEVIEWTKDDKHILVEQTVAGKVRYLSIDVNNSIKSVDISSVFSKASLDMVRFSGGNSTNIYSLKSGVVSRYDYSKKVSQTLLRSVKSYQPFSNDTISYVRYNQVTKNIEAGVLHDGTETILYKKPTTNPKLSGFTSYSEFDGVFYFAVSLDGDGQVKLFRNPIQEPILPKQLLYAQFKSAPDKPFKLSENGEFILVSNKNQMTVFNLESANKYYFKEPSKSNTVAWLDSHHIVFKTIDGMNYLTDFDGTNKYKILKTDLSGVMFTKDLQGLFTLNKAGSKAALLFTDLKLN